MTVKLDEILAPGEAVIYRDPRSWAPLRSFAVLVICLYVVGLLFAFIRLADLGWSLASNYPIPLLALVFVGFGWLALREYAIAAVITDRRVAYKSGWGRLDIVELALDEIEAVYFSAAGVGGLVIVQGAKGDLKSFPGLRFPDAFARSLAVAASLPEPPVSCRKMCLLRWAFIAFVLLVAFGGLALLMKWFPPVGDATGDSVSGVLTIAGGAVFMLISLVAGFYLGLGVGWSLEQLFLSDEEIRYWIACHTRQQAPDAKTAQEPPRWERCSRHWSNWIIGTATSKSMEGALNSGEHVLLHATPRWAPHDWHIDLIIYALSIGTVALVGVLTFDMAGLISLAAVFVSPIFFMFRHYIQNGSRETLVTERRMLHAVGWIRRDVTEVDTADIAAIKVFDAKIQLTLRDGGLVNVVHPGQAPDVAVTLSRAAGLTPPSIPAHKVLLVEWFYHGIVFTASIAVALLILKWLYLTHAEGFASFAEPGFICAFLYAAWLGTYPGGMLGRPLALILLRPFVDFRRMTAWMGASPVFWAQPNAPQASFWPVRLMRRLAKFLYGSSIGRDGAAA